MKPPTPALPRLWEVPTPKLPKPLSFDSHNKAEADAMVAWVNEYLEVRQAERENKCIMELYEELRDHGGVDFDPETGRATFARPTEDDLIDQAWEGDVEPLREYHRKRNPRLVPCISLPNRGRGGGKHHRNLKAEMAAEDVLFIRHQLWQSEYGRWKRTKDNAPSAEKIAADFHHVDVRSVRKALPRVSKRLSRAKI